MKESLITFYNNQSNSTMFFDIIKSVNKNNINIYYHEVSFTKKIL